MIEIPESMQYAMHSHASRLRKRFPMVEHADIWQEMALWWYAHQRKVRRYTDSDDEKYGQRKLSRALRNAGLAFCHREKARMVGYDVGDLFFYSVGLLRELLVAVYDDDSWVRVGRGEVSDERKAKSGPRDGMDGIAALVDVKRAVALLAPEYRRLIEWQFRDGRDDAWLSLRLQTTEDAARMRVQRALHRLQDELGGDRPDWLAAGAAGDRPAAPELRDDDERTGDHDG